MGYLDIKDVDIKDSGPSFDKFDVDKNDKALIHIPNNMIVQEHVHVLHREEPTMVDRNGRKVPEWSRESFAGTFICLGDFDTVAASPSYGDPVNCPACRAMNKGPKLVERPKRTFAMNVIRYATKKQTYDLRNNNVEVQIWRHADIKKIEPILMAARQQPLNSIDFMVEADNSDWKKYIIQPKLGATTFTGNPDLQSNVDDAKDNLFDKEVLTEACGKKMTADALDAEISRLVSEHRLEAGDGDDGELFGTPTTPEATASTGDSPAVEQRTEEGDLAPVAADDLDAISQNLFG